MLNISGSVVLGVLKPQHLLKNAYKFEELLYVMKHIIQRDQLFDKTNPEIVRCNPRMEALFNVCWNTEDGDKGRATPPQKCDDNGQGGVHLHHQDGAHANGQR